MKEEWIERVVRYHNTLLSYKPEIKFDFSNCRKSDKTIISVRLIDVEK